MRKNYCGNLLWQPVGPRNYRQWGYIGFNGDGSDTLRVPHGEPYAGKLHVRFDEGAGVPYGGVPLYSTPHCIQRVCGWFEAELQNYCGNLLWQSCLTLLFLLFLNGVASNG